LASSRRSKEKNVLCLKESKVSDQSEANWRSFCQDLVAFSGQRDRSLPVSDVFTHHRTVSSCHLCNLAMLLGRRLRWDPAKEGFVGDEQASKLVSRPQRAPYEIEV